MCVCVCDVVVDGLFGWKDHQFRFGQVQLKVVVFHPCGYISKTVRDPRLLQELFMIMHLIGQIGLFLLQPCNVISALSYTYLLLYIPVDMQILHSGIDIMFLYYAHDLLSVLLQVGYILGCNSI